MSSGGALKFSPFLGLLFLFRHLPFFIPSQSAEQLGPLPFHLLTQPGLLLYASSAIRNNYNSRLKMMSMFACPLMVQFSDHTALFDAERLALCLLFLYEGWMKSCYWTVKSRPNANVCQFFVKRNVKAAGVCRRPPPISTVDVLHNSAV